MECASRIGMNAQYSTSWRLYLASWCRTTACSRKRGKISAKVQSTSRRVTTMNSNLGTSGYDLFENSTDLKTSIDVFCISKVAERTAIICYGLPNACAVFKLLNDYSAEAAGYLGAIRHIELADSGTLKLAIMARGFASWHFGVEDLVVAALDMGCVCRSAKVGFRLVPGEYKTLEYYLGSELYDPSKDIHRVECSCRPEIVEKVVGSANSQTLGGHVTRWVQQESTREKRIPAILSHGGCCVAFKGLKDKEKKKVARANKKQVEEFVEAFKHAAEQLGQDTTEEPRDMAYEPYLDETSESVEGAGDMYGPVRCGSKLFMEAMNDMESFEIGVENALIVVAKIVLCKTAGVEPPYRPHIINLALANGFGQIFVICENSSFDRTTATTATGAVLTGGKKTSLDEMRALILKYLGSNNVLVGFNLGWTLAALGLVLPGSHVIDIGTEEVFQAWCRSLTGLQKGWPGVLVEHMINSYDRRIPAVLLNINIYPEGQVDVWYEAFYTACVWNVIAIQVADARARQDVHKVKLMVPVGSGTAPTAEEEVYLTIDMDLTSIQQLPGLNQLAANPAELVSMIVSTPVSKMRRHGSEAELQNFIDQCRAMVVEYQPRIPWPPSFRSDFGDHKLRNQMAVNLALPSHYTMEDPFLMTLLINHHTGASIKELQSIDLGNKEISTPIGRRSLTIWLDFGLNVALFERFRNRGLPQPDEEIVVPEETATATSAPESSKDCV